MRDAPIVLVHGLFGFDQMTLGGADYFRRIPQALREAGFIVPPPPRLNTAGSIARRAGDLELYLNTEPQVAGQRVHLIAHSMGGLDARFMISRPRAANEPDMAGRVLSLTAIGTPHQGSPIADLIHGGGHKTLLAFLQHLRVDLHGIGDLTFTASQAFNETFTERDGIRYFSIAGRFEPESVLGAPIGVLGPFQRIIRKAEIEKNLSEGANDGLVSVRSATFGADPSRWKFLGTWDANHFQLINWGANLIPSPLELGDDTIIAKYKELAALVAAEVDP